MKTVFWLFSLAFFFGCTQSSEKNSPSEKNFSLSFEKSSKPVKTLSFAELMKSFTKKKLKVWEPHEKKEVVFEGIYLVPILDKVYGSTWRQYDEVLLVAVDGYQSATSVEKIIKYQPFLASKRLDQAEFKVTNQAQNNEYVDLGPYYLIWNNIQHSELKTSGAYGWPYQVNHLNLVMFAELYPKTAPSLKASKNVQLGFKHFKRYCISCHSLKEEGGEKGPPLDELVSYMSEEKLVEWVLNPQKLMPETTMPAMAENLKDEERLERARLIYEYLKVFSPSQKP